MIPNKAFLPLTGLLKGTKDFPNEACLVMGHALSLEYI